MKKALFLIFLITCLCYTGETQNIEPSNDAQGYLNGKNILVDYCAGIFHYTVPLFDLNSGGFKIPLSLNYSSRQAMQNTPNGIVGKSWSLQTGGIVTRVVRGGIADEEKTKGFIFQGQLDSLDEKFITDANNHMRDGESDIFTASFGNQSVNYIIRKEGNSVVVTPLERTNVKIVCEYDSSASNIHGWIVTDENGVKYIFRTKEWTRNLNRFSDVITNNLKDKAYVSSWYLSVIELPNACRIRYTYETEDALDYAGNLINKSCDFTCVNYQVTKYYYGRKMESFKFNFTEDKRSMFEYYMQAAENKISFQAFAQSHPDLCPPADFSSAFLSSDISFSGLMSTIKTIGGVLGTVASYRGGNFPTVPVMETLNEMLRYYRSNIMVYNDILSATNYLIDAITTERIDSSSVSTNFSYRISTPILKKISTSMEEICFSYNPFVKEIILKDYRGIQKQKIILEINSEGLSGMSWSGSDDVSFQQQQFNYSGGLLSGIALTTGGEITIEYESNVCNTEISCGKRVKTIVLKDGLDHCDTIGYRYPYPGYLLYNQISYVDTIQYSDWGRQVPDRVVKSSPICKGIVYVNQGNNGIVYHYVEEELKGKGVNSYLFSVPAASGNSDERSYAYWLCGIPLGKAVYNMTGQLVYLQKNNYFTDLIHSRFNYGKEWFETGVNDFNYNQNQWQVELCEYFMGGDELYNYYQKQPKTLLYRTFENKNVYLDPLFFYDANIRPRKVIISPRQGYKMYYGGKTVLKSQKEYSFSNSTSQSQSITHLTGTLPTGAVLVSDIEYKYDNPTLSINPTRMIRTKANGDKLISIKRTPLDISTSDEMIKRMQESNIISPVIKEQVLILKNGSNNYLLLDEVINHYKEIEGTAGKIVFLPEKTFHFAGSRSIQVSTSVPAITNNSLTGNVNEYREQLYSYQAGNDEILLEKLVTSGNIKSFCHDLGNNQMVMETENCERAYIDGVDRYRTLFNSTGSIRDEKVAGNTLLNYLKVSTDAFTRRFIVTLLVNPASSKLSLAYSVIDNTEKNYRTSEKTVVPGKWQIVQFDIDVASGTSLKVNFPTGGMAVGVIVPRGVVYKAYSYDSAGWLFGTFDQNGSLERYEYDGAGRLLKVYDKDSYLLKEFEYAINI